MNEEDDSSVIYAARLSLENRVKLQEAIGSGVLNDANFPGIISSLIRRDKRVYKKNRKKPLPDCAGGQDSLITRPPLISFQDSLSVWGEDTVPIGINGKSQLEDLYSAPSPDPGLLRPEYNPSAVWLNGLSLKMMAEKFPGHDWRAYRQNNQPVGAQFYLIGWDAKLSGFSAKQEEKKRPTDCWRLDLNLSVELLLTLSALSRPLPEFFLRTPATNSHSDQEVCVGLEAGQLKFLLSGQAEKKGIPWGFLWVRAYSE